MKISLKSLLSPRNLLLFGILALILFLRVYRVEALLGFYYDQGRDALVIWNLWHNGKFFLVGPVSGLAGIFLGPFYYYLIAPFYLIGAGNPAYPAVFLAILACLGSFFLYKLGTKMHSGLAGIFALLISGFSYYIVTAGRWLSNPTGILLTSVILLWSMWEIANKAKGYWWLVAALMISLSLQFQSASAIFYLPMFVVFAIWQRRNLPNKKIIIGSLLIFFLSLAPQILFNFRHENIILKSFTRVLVEEQSFRPNFWDVLPQRAEYFWTVSSSKIFPEWPVYSAIFIALAAGALLLSARRLKKILILFLIFLGAPIVGITFFQGNFGNLYDYYLTGYYLGFILLFSIGLAEVWRGKSGKIIVAIFFMFFFLRNIGLTKNYLTDSITGPTRVVLGNELQAVDWVLKDARGRGEFNVDVYVPPVIPYTYDYLFLWRATKSCGESLCGLVKDRQVPLLYTLEEADPNHWERYFAWTSRQEGIGRIEESVKFGGISVERRARISQ